MSRQKRMEIIRQIADLRGSAVLCYITGDRENVNTRIAPDVTQVFYRHLELFRERDQKEQKQIDLFLYTRGGDVLTPWRLVHLIREYTARFTVIVPFRCYSAGTLLCLGADEIIMGKMGELGPIDPSVVNAFNPQDPNNPAARIPVNIEDVYSYLALAGEKAGVCSSDQQVKAFTLLAERIHPLALGNVHRNYLLIRSLAKKLLAMHQQPMREGRSEHIVDNLTEKLYAHSHMISRREAAEEITLNVLFPELKLESLIWALYQDYAEDMSLADPFNPAEQLCGTRTDFEVTSGIVESLYGLDTFVFAGVVERKEFPEPGKVNVNILKQGWRTIS
ncbi:MAG: Serine dehydrogenase proteinase [Pelotomaculum sp. PtaB.Bin104]|nr:MAG: Serine dehydrogenase proteinase [Pelotomaculum sp. PtaB.Bin104]